MDWGVVLLRAAIYTFTGDLVLGRPSVSWRLGHGQGATRRCRSIIGCLALGNPIHYRFQLELKIEKNCPEFLHISASHWFCTQLNLQNLANSAYYQGSALSFRLWLDHTHEPWCIFLWRSGKRHSPSTVHHREMGRQDCPGVAAWWPLAAHIAQLLAYRAKYP